MVSVIWSRRFARWAAALLVSALAGALLLGALAAAAWSLTPEMAPKRVRAPPGFRKLLKREAAMGAAPDGSVADTAIQLVGTGQLSIVAARTMGPALKILALA